MCLVIDGEYEEVVKKGRQLISELLEAKVRDSFDWVLF